MIKLVVGLGNPGVEYEFNRHNIGWLCLDQLEIYDELIWKSKFKGEYASYTLKNSEKVYFLKPQTYMNLSGESVIKLMQFFKIKIDEVLVIHDELDLDFEKLMIKKGGGLAGHNGLKSIASLTGSQEFSRLRLGISRPRGGNVSSWVLTNFSKIEEEILPDFLKNASNAVMDALSLGIKKTQEKYNKKNNIGKKS
jgi:peptidyl-tRNA hydrolase, PTH1 family